MGALVHHKGGLSGRKELQVAGREGERPGFAKHDCRGKGARLTGGRVC